jgi:hypothetical protein
MGETISAQSLSFPTPYPWRRRAVGLIFLALVVALAAAGVAMDRRAPTMAPASGGGSDALFYRQVIDDLAKGRSYYEAAPAQMRKDRFPLRPFVTVRPPLLAVSLARLPNEVARRAALIALAVAVMLAWGLRLRPLWRAEPLGYGFAMLLLFSGVSPDLAPNAYLFHETWAALLIALSLALRQPDRFLTSLILGLIAALLRELAIPFLLVMAALAALEGRRREALAWTAAMAAAALALAAHAMMVAQVTSLADRPSPGWTRLGGWAFVLKTTQWNLIVAAAPALLAPILATPALFGLFGLKGALARRTALTVFGYAGLFCIVGRPENFYWGLMIAPLWPLGLVGVWDAAKALAAGHPPPILRTLKGLEAWDGAP